VRFPAAAFEGVLLLHWKNPSVDGAKDFESRRRHGSGDAEPDKGVFKG
jgi:hypothetical protein